MFDAGDGLKLTVLGPDEERVKALQEEWNKQIKKAGVAKIAEFADDSVFNLSSITVLATFKENHAADRRRPRRLRSGRYCAARNC